MTAKSITEDRIIHSINLKSLPAVIMGNLCHDKDSSGRNMVFAPMVSEAATKDLPFFELPVDCLMPCSSSSHLPVMPQTLGIQWYGTLDILVGSVSHNLLSSIQHFLGSVTKDGEVIGCSTRKGPSETNNVSSEDTNGNLISKSRLVEFLGIPAFAERNRLLNQEVSSIHGDQASIALEIAVSTIPSYLNKMSGGGGEM